jgi:hypothetical protein
MESCVCALFSDGEQRTLDCALIATKLSHYLIVEKYVFQNFTS